MSALKYDQDKPRMDLLDADALEGLAKVLGFGAQKYAANNWRSGFAYSRLIGALLRHALAIQRGEDIDPESGLPHVDHLGCCWMFLSHHMKNERLKKFDDRYKEPVGDAAKGIGAIAQRVPEPSSPHPFIDSGLYLRPAQLIGGGGRIDVPNREGPTPWGASGRHDG